MPGNISTWQTMFRWRLLDFLVMSHDTSFVPKCLFSMYQMFGKRRSHSWKKAFILQHQPGPNRKLLCKYIPYCQMQFHILLKCMLLYRSTQIFISSVYTFWVVRAADEETVFFTSTHSLVTAPVSSVAFKACWSYVCGICWGMWWPPPAPFWWCQMICSTLMMELRLFYVFAVQSDITIKNSEQVYNKWICS